MNEMRDYEIGKEVLKSTLLIIIIVACTFFSLGRLCAVASLALCLLIHRNGNEY